MPTARAQFEDALQANAPIFGIQLGANDSARLGEYYELVLKWNDRLHLVAPCSPEEFATRHVLESLLVLPHLGTGTRLIDVGSGAGLPAIPCLAIDGRLHGTLFESSKRKAVFLKEALQQLTVPARAQVIPMRFEETVAPAADVVTCRAIDQFEKLLPDLIRWAPPKSTLLFFAGIELAEEILRLFPSAEREHIPLSERRFLMKIDRRTAP
ncbi:MAG TPA: 16S rRNA (guanine(527)-N(7))-methyltransferase RsmG [Pyrinomonadaceae bacterium]|nr:16S rRNA (guanine(527)-N(7))-methyltransferase RsmG [Pyrinomonadaceae bacterium]